jgi:hypothetical protein
MYLNIAHRLLATSIHPEVQQCVDKTLKRLKSKYPIARKTKVVFERRNNATTDAWDMEIKLPIFGKDKPLEAVDREENFANSNCLQYGLEGTIIHEFGHALNTAIIQSLKPNEDDLEAWQQTKKQLEKELGHPSPYSQKNNSEWFAEQFLYEMKGHGHKLLDAIDQWIHKR